MRTEEITIVDKGTHVFVEFVGEFSEEAGKRCVDIMLEACQEYGRRAVLLDCREMSGMLTIVGRFQVIDYAQVVRGTISRIALVNQPENLLPDSFAENVAHNRGLNLRTFTEMDAAESWIGQD